MDEGPECAGHGDHAQILVNLPSSRSPVATGHCHLDAVEQDPLMVFLSV